MAFGLRTKSFGFIEGEAHEFVGALQWWNQIDDSDQWQRGTYYALCAAYTLVSFVALVGILLSFSWKILSLEKNEQVFFFIMALDTHCLFFNHFICFGFGLNLYILHN